MTAETTEDDKCASKSEFKFGFGSFVFSASSKKMAEIISIFALFVMLFLLYLLHSHAAEVKEAGKELARVDAKVNEEMGKRFDRLEQRQLDTTTAIRELTYVISISQEKRQELKLDMPDSLRSRIRNYRD